jgi:hypothetical protein
MKTIVAVLLLTGLALGQNTQPSLSDTLSFMNRSLEEDFAGSIESHGDSGCEVQLIRYHSEKVTIPHGLHKVEGNPRMGIPDRHSYEWAIIDPATHLRSDFNLKDIDPESIKANEVWSLKAIADMPDKFDPNLPHPDRSIVFFKTSNLIKAIHARDFVDESTVKQAIDKAGKGGFGEPGFLLEPGTKTRLAKDQTGDIFLMESNNGAIRFTKAFKHAVELCGGKPSAF